MNTMMSTHTALSMSRLLLGLALTTATASAQQSATTERESPTRKAFAERDVSLEKVVRESKQRNEEQESITTREFQVGQPEPGRAARARTSADHSRALALTRL